VQGLTRDLPETALHATSRNPTPRSSAAPFTWAVVWPREVLRGGVNHPHIDGKDGVAGSIPAGGSTPRLTSGNADESPSAAIGAGHIRSGRGGKGQRAVRALALLSSNFGGGVSGMA
jgi:hypothetical protein